MCRSTGRDPPPAPRRARSAASSVGSRSRNGSFGPLPAASGASPVGNGAQEPRRFCVPVSRLGTCGASPSGSRVPPGHPVISAAGASCLPCPHPRAAGTPSPLGPARRRWSPGHAYCLLIAWFVSVLLTSAVGWAEDSAPRGHLTVYAAVLGCHNLAGWCWGWSQRCCWTPQYPKSSPTMKNGPA